MPPGKQHHIWPGAMQRRLVVEALWLAFYQHIWLHKISVLVDPRKIHIMWSTEKKKKSTPQKRFPEQFVGEEINPCHKQT